MEQEPSWAGLRVPSPRDACLFSVALLDGGYGQADGGRQPWGRGRATAIERWGTVKGFAEAMSERAIRGSSRTSVTQYLEGEAIPSTGFLHVAAEILGVRYGWLLEGAGAITGEEERKRQEQEEAKKQERALFERGYDWSALQTGFDAFLAEHFGEPDSGGDLHTSWLTGSDLWMCATSLYYDLGGRSLDTEPGATSRDALDYKVTIGRRVAEAFLLPSIVLNVKPRDLTPDERAVYGRLLDAAFQMVSGKVRGTPRLDARPYSLPPTRIQVLPADQERESDG